MTDNTQAAMEALEGLEFQFSKLSDKDWTATFQIIRAALQSKPVDVEWDLNERELSLNQIESDYHEIDKLLFDEMPAAEEAQDFFLTHDLQAIIDELKSWRKQHWSEGFRPDYCAAKQALEEHLNTLPRSPVTKEDIKLASSITRTEGPVDVEEYYKSVSQELLAENKELQKTIKCLQAVCKATR